MLDLLVTKMLLTYFNGTVIVAFLKISFSPFVTVFPNNLALYSKDFKLLLKIIKNKTINILLFQKDFNHILSDYTLS